MFIVIEGADACGKTAQVEILEARFAEYGLPVEKISFPRYDTDIGKVISRYLKCDLLFRDSKSQVLGTKEALEASLVFQALNSMDKLDASHVIQSWLRLGKQVVACRWWQSAVAYGAATGLSVRRLCNMHRPLPRADLNILLTVPEDVTLARRPDLRDHLESNRELQGTVRKVYQDLWKNDWAVDPKLRLDSAVWVEIDGSQSFEDVHKEIWKHVMALFATRFSQGTFAA
jgi:thymidylate kinase